MKFLLLFFILLSSTSYAQYWVQDAPFIGKKAIKFQDNFYHWDTGHWIKLKTNQVVAQYPAKTSFNLQWEGFLKEASLILTLANDRLKYANPEYVKLFHETQSKVKFYLQASQVDQAIVQKALASLREKLKYSRADKINSMNLAFAHLQDLWPKNARTQKFWNETLLIPLSVEWFRSNPELSKFFDKVWIKSGYDIRIQGGLSGEGVSINKANLRKPDDSYTQMKILFFKTLKFVSSLEANHPVKKTMEWSWLAKNEYKISTNMFHRLIFIHENTWKHMEKSPEYADYVMVNQSIGFINSFPFFSLVLHELNVNSGEFGLLPNDTHLPEYITSDLFKQKELPKEHTGISQILKIQPELSLIHLYSFFKALENN